MSDALTPLRHAYGVEPVGAPEAPGAAGHPEQEALRQLRDLLDAWPVPSPAPETVAAVEARAAVVAAAVAQTDAALAHAFAGRPQPRPSADAVAAVLARAADPAPDVLAAASPVEEAVLDQSLRALDRLPTQRPDASVIAAIEARAAEASSALAAVRAVYLDVPAGDSVEAETLRQSRAAVERAFAARPRPRPSAGAVDAVLARAAEAAGVEAEPAVEASPVEGAVLAQSHLALDRLPRPRPSAATLDAVRLAAVTAGAAPVRGDRPARSARRAPARPARRRTPAGVWAGAAGLLVAALAVLAVLPRGATEGDAPLAVAALAEADAAEVPAAERPDATEAEPTESVDDAGSAAPPPAGALAAAAPIAAFAPPPARAERAPSEPAPQTAAPPAQTVAAAARPATRTPADPPPSWEMSEDVRTLSLRLQELGSEDDLAWDDVPSEAFGQPTSPSAGAAPGLQSVRAGTPAVRSAPARARLRTDTSSVQR